MKNKKILWGLLLLTIILIGVLLFMKQNNQEIIIQEEKESVVDVVETPQKEIKEECENGVYVEEFDLCGRAIGRSVEDRPIYVFTIGGGDKDVLLIGGIHTGTEENTHELAVDVLKYYRDKPELVSQNVSLHIIPALNVDGVANNTHNNANNVDLNRNWKTEDWKADTYHPVYGQQEGAGGEKPLSEPETLALYKYIQEVNPEITIVWHSQAGSVEGNNIKEAEDLAAVYAKESGYEYIDEWTYYEVTGDFLVAMKEVNIPAFEVELSSREKEFEQNIKGVEKILDSFKK